MLLTIWLLSLNPAHVLALNLVQFKGFDGCLHGRACHLIHLTKSISLFVNPLNIIKTIKFSHLLSLFQSQKLFTWNHVKLPHLSFTKPWLEFSLISLFALRALVKSLRSSDWYQWWTIWYTFQKCLWFQRLTSLAFFFLINIIVESRSLCEIKLGYKCQVQKVYKFHLQCLNKPQTIPCGIWWYDIQKRYKGQLQRSYDSSNRILYNIGYAIHAWRSFYHLQ